MRTRLLDVRVSRILDSGVPLRNHARLSFETEDAYRGGAEGEKASSFGRQAKPAGGHDAKYMAVGEDDRVARAGNHALDDFLSAGPDLLDGFPGGDAVAPKRPAGPFGPNLRCCAAFVSTVVPFAEIRIHDCAFLESGETAGFACALERAG